MLWVGGHPLAADESRVNRFLAVSDKDVAHFPRKRY